MVNRSVILVAGGQGTRMKSALPKQFLSVNGRPVLYYSIKAFFNFDPDMQLIVVLPEMYHSYWSDLSKKLPDLPTHEIANGGDTRFHSVKNGLALAKGNVIAVHDAVRPLVSQLTLQRGFEAAEDGKCSIPVIPANETIRHVSESGNKALNRNELFIVQTPQVFPSAIIHEAFNTQFQSKFTDCASVVEQAGFSIHLVEGNTENIKITHPGDLALLDFYLNHE